MNRKMYRSPTIDSHRSYETSALACGKTSSPPPGSFHFAHGLNLTGHMGPGFGGSESYSGTAIVSTSPGLFSQSYSYSGLCLNWVSWQS